MKIYYSMLCAILATQLAQGATFNGIGDLPGGRFFSAAFDVSADGSVVVGVSASSGGDNEAIRWTRTGGLVGLGNTIPDGFFAYAVGVSDDGSVIGGHGFSTQGIEAVRWENGTGRFIGDLGGGRFQSDVRGVSGDGSTLVGYGYKILPDGGDDSVPVYWNAQGIFEILDESGGSFRSNAYGVNRDGSVITGGFPFRWESGVFERMGALPGAAEGGVGLAVNSDGSVIVGNAYSVNGQEAYRWTRQTGLVGLGDLPGGTFSSQAWDLSDDGSIVVGVGTTDRGGEAFLWDSTHGMRNLQSVLVDEYGLGPALSGWWLQNAYGCSHNGRVIVGHGLNPLGQVEGWIVDLDAMAPPPPPSGSRIIGICIPQNSQNPFSRPAYDETWRVSTPPCPLNVNAGIGIIINPAVVEANDNHDFALHQNDGIQPSPLYIAPHIPNPATVTITYRFDRPTLVTAVDIAQHVNGITQVEGLLGDSLDSMQSLGPVFGPSGDVIDSFVVPPDAEGHVQRFSFRNTAIAGTLFQVIVRKTSFSLAFATHRIYPVDASGATIPAATGCTSGSIVELSIPEHSQATVSARAEIDHIWKMSVPPSPFDMTKGIGITVNPKIPFDSPGQDFSLHQDGITMPYVAPYTPNPAMVTLTFRFSAPVSVSGVEVAQHLFGVTRIEGFLGNSLDSLASLGSIFGPSGDVTDGFVVAQEGASQVFRFNPNTQTGTILQLIVRKTAHPAAFAAHRFFPLDEFGGRILPAGSTFCPSESETCGGTVLNTVLTAPDAHSFDSFGTAISISRNVLIIGALAANGPNTPSDREGAAYIYRKTGLNWEFETKLSVAELGERYFGESVGISDDVAVVSGLNAGAAYVYRRSAGVWDQEAILPPDPGTASGANYGRSIALDGDTIVVGVPRDGAPGAETGSVYVFRYRNGQWAKEAILLGSDTARGDEFGNAVSISGDRIAVGSILANATGPASGAIYVFKRTGYVWAQEAKLVGNDTAAFDTLGNQVSISGIRIAAGAQQDDSSRGSAYVFKFDGASWTQEAKLLASDGAAGDRFGIHLAIRDGTIVVGSNAKCNAVVVGAAYVFSLTQGVWAQVAKLVAPDRSEPDGFGFGTALDCGIIAIGATRDDTAVADAGAVYLYQLDSDCHLSVRCPSDLTDVPTDPGRCDATAIQLGVPIAEDDSPLAAISNDAPLHFPAGETTVTWTVTDTSGNTGTCTQKVTVRDHEAPTVGPITAPLEPIQVAAIVQVSAAFRDNCGVVSGSWDWDDGTTSAGVIGGSLTSGTATGSHSYTAPAVYRVKLTIRDGAGNVAVSVFEFVVVYDPSAGFVTGGGWINSTAGAYRSNPTLTGKATFGFVSKYQKGANVPTGETEFNFHLAAMDFHSTIYQWLVVAGAKAQFKGSGTINGSGDYAFLLTTIDGQITGGGGIDKFRIKIWEKLTGAVVYDNQLGTDDNADPTTAIQEGSIVIHKAN